MKDYPLVEEQEKINEHIFAEAQGRIIILSAAPTATVPLLKEDELGIYGNDFYHRVEDTIYKLSSDSQTAITQDET